MLSSLLGEFCGCFVLCCNPPCDLDNDDNSEGSLMAAGLLGWAIQSVLMVSAVWRLIINFLLLLSL